jgi:regulator of replication initiation timing
MNSRFVAAVAALLLAAALYLNHRSTNRTNAELNERIAHVEDQVQRIKSASTEQQLEAENLRLRAENQRLKASLAQFTGTPAAVGAVARVSHQQQDTPNDPLAFYRRNPELMKRYFPQLYNQEIAKQQKADEVPAPPSE